MLTEEHLKLLTALVDGELDSHGRNRAIRLVKKSPAARRVYDDLKRDAERLRALPRVAAPKELAAQVLHQTAPLAVSRPATEAAAPLSAPFPTWLGAVLAASLLLGVTVMSFWFFSTGNGNNSHIVDNKDKDKGVEPIYQVKLQLTITQLSEDGAHEKLKAVLRKDNAFRLDVTCRDGEKVVSRLAKLLGDNDIKLINNAPTRKATAGKKGRKFLLFMENVLPIEISTLLYDLGRSERVLPSTVQQVALFSMSKENRGEVADLLGVEQEDLRPAEKGKKLDLGWKGLPPIILGKNGTNGKSRPPRQPEPPRRPSRLAVVLPLMGDAPASPNSDEVRQFVAARRAPRPGTLQVVFVLHEVA